MLPQKREACTGARFSGQQRGRPSINPGAKVEEVGYPTGNDEVDRLLRSAQARFERATPILRVEDMARSLRYYVDVLGFSNAEWGGKDFTLLTRDGAGIYLSLGDQGQPGTRVWIGVEDVDVLYEEYRNAGAIILHPPESMPWAREMKVGDPDGHVRRFGSDPEE